MKRKRILWITGTVLSALTGFCFTHYYPALIFAVTVCFIGAICLVKALGLKTRFNKYI